MNFVSKFRNKNLKNILSKLNSFSKHHFEIMANRRGVEKVFENREQAEGVGARVRRSIGTHDLRNFDPFLMLDEFSSKAPAGFPDHPHRGFETVTYLLKGAIAHEDFCGNKGVIGPGDLQWMTAGRGIVHCEMPVGEETCHGLQLWVNLSRNEKMIEPSYQDLKDAQIPRKSENGVSVKVIAGEAMGVKSPVYTRTPTTYLDFQLEPGAKYTQPIANDWNAFVFILAGAGTFGVGSVKPKKATAHHTLILSKGDSLEFENDATDSNEKLHFVLIAGQPINEPVVQHGPFVMNSQEEIARTFEDYRSGKNGFENAPKWESDYVKSH